MRRVYVREGNLLNEGELDMIVGFTGTREGVTQVQKERVSAILYNLLLHRYDRLLHGGAEGADEFIHSAANQFSYRTEIYPCNATRREFWLKHKEETKENTTIHAVRDPLDRNRIIAMRCNHLIATPFQMSEINRSGTWATIRYARGARKSLTIVLPDGTVSEERLNGDRNLLNLHRAAQ